MRYLMIENMKSILDLTTNINYDMPLPPPKKIADELNKFVLRTIKGWALEFGPHHRKLLLCYEFLLHKKHVGTLGTSEIRLRLFSTAIFRFRSISKN